MSQVHGEVAPGFERVRDAFAANFEHNGEVGAACSAYYRGEKVVDLWGGVADGESGRPWAEDSIILVASSTKGATAICANLLVQRGELDLDAPVARSWTSRSRSRISWRGSRPSGRSRGSARCGSRGQRTATTP